MKNTTTIKVYTQNMQKNTQKQTKLSLQKTK